MTRHPKFWIPDWANARLMQQPRINPMVRGDPPVQSQSITSGPHASANGAPFYFRYLFGNVIDWDVGFDIDGNPPADIWENLRQWLDASAAGQDYKDEVEAQAVSEGWIG